MSSTRAELFNPLIIPILAGLAFDGIMQRPYLAPVNWKIVTGICALMHVHYGIGVVSHSIAKIVCLFKFTLTVSFRCMDWQIISTLKYSKLHQ